MSSNDGYCVVDLDMTISEFKTVHQFKTAYSRDFQLMMDIEIKTMGADLSPAQRDTLHIRNQLMRNRRQTPTKNLAFQAGAPHLVVWQQPTEYRMNYCCAQDGDVIPIKENSHE